MDRTSQQAFDLTYKQEKERVMKVNMAKTTQKKFLLTTSKTKSSRATSQDANKFNKSFYFDKPDQPTKCTEVNKFHAKSTPMGYVHDG